MKKIFLTTVAVLTTLVFASAQSKFESGAATVDAGPGYPVLEFGMQGGKPYFAHRKIFFDGTNVIEVRGEKGHLYIQRFNKSSMKIISTNDYTDVEKNFIYEDCIQLKDKIFIFFSDYPGKTHIPKLYIREVDLEKGTFKAPFIELFSAESKIDNDYLTYPNNTKFSFHVSTDSLSFLVKYIRKSSTGMWQTGPETHGMYVFNGELKKIRGSEVLLPVHDYQMVPIGFTLDASGNIYMAAKIFGKKDKYNVNEALDNEYKAALYKLEPAKTEFAKINLDLGGKSATDIKIFNNPDGYLLCAGTYANAGSISKTKGVFICNMNENGTTGDVKILDINPEILKPSGGKSKNSPIDYLKVSEIKPQADKSIIVVAEQRFSINGASGTAYKYYDLFLIKLDTSRNMIWLKQLPKRCRSISTTEYFRYLYLQNGNSINIVYFDDYNNLGAYSNSKEMDDYFESKHGYVNCYNINASSGEISTFPVFDMKNIKGVEYHNYDIEFGINFKTDEIWLEVYKKSKENCMLRVKFKE